MPTVSCLMPGAAAAAAKLWLCPYSVLFHNLSPLRPFTQRRSRASRAPPASSAQWGGGQANLRKNIHVCRQMEQSRANLGASAWVCELKDKQNRRRGATILASYRVVPPEKERNIKKKISRADLPHLMIQTGGGKHVFCVLVRRKFLPTTTSCAAALLLYSQLACWVVFGRPEMRMWGSAQEL